MHQKISRRSFTRLTLALPFAGTSTLISARDRNVRIAQAEYAGHLLNGEEAAREFLARHESLIAPLRAVDLPNTLAPFFVVLARPMNEPDEKPHG